MLIRYIQILINKIDDPIKRKILPKLKERLCSICIISKLKLSIFTL